MELLNHSLKQFASISVTQFVIMTVFELTVVFVILVCFAKSSFKKYSLVELLSIFVLVVYINVILQLTLLGRKDGSRIGVELELFRYLGQGRYTAQMLMYAFLNVLLFVPYGFIVQWLPWFSRLKKGIGIFLSTGVCLASSLMIEIVQLLTGRGYYELEDLLCNTVGGFVGVLLYWAVYKLIVTEEEYGCI